MSDLWHCWLALPAIARMAMLIAAAIFLLLLF